MNDTVEGLPNIIWPTDPAAVDAMANYIVTANSEADVTPEERKDALSKIRSMISNANSPLFQHLTNRMFQNSLARKYGVISLSRRIESPLMWAHYADVHNGMALEFEDGLVDAQPMEVVYRQKRPQVRAELGRSLDDLEFFRVKSPDWQYEHEVRHMLKLEHTELLTKTDRKGHSMHVVPINFSCLRSVAFGCDYDPDILDQTQDALKAYPSVLYFEAELDPQFYRVSRRLLG
ncbi:MAG TPA: hypothetical protein VG734_17715 [Lacunisphaera sp.]|nr:hypothetical protein [Lacunisphaera sp.]